MFESLINYAKRFRGFLAFAAFVMLSLLAAFLWAFSQGAFNSVISNVERLSAEQFFWIIIIFLLMPFIVLMTLIALSYRVTRPNNNEASSKMLTVIVHEGKKVGETIPKANVSLQIVPKALSEISNSHGEVIFLFPPHLENKRFNLTAKKEGYKTNTQKIKLNHESQKFISLQRIEITSPSDTGVDRERRNLHDETPGESSNRENQREQINSKQLYAETILKRYENIFKDQTFIPPFYQIDQPGMPSEECVSGMEKLLEFLTQNDASIYFILGEFGTGKSWLIEKLVCEFANMYLQDPTNNPIPVYASLRNLREIDIEFGDFLATLVEKENNPIQQSDKKIFLLDALDEAAQDKKIDDFYPIMQSIAEYPKKDFPDCPDKVIISCRRTFFEKLAPKTGLNRQDITDQIIQINLPRWSKQQIKNYVSSEVEKRHIPHSTKAILDRFIHRHGELIGRALTASIIMEGWQKLQGLSERNELDEYHIFKELMIEVSLEKWAESIHVGTEETVHIVKRFIRELAVDFLTYSKIQIPTIQFNMLLQKSFQRWSRGEYAQTNNLSFDWAERQAKTRTLLELTPDGNNFRFCDQVIWEFLIADMVIEDVLRISSDSNKALNSLAHENLKASPRWYDEIANAFILPYLESKGTLTDFLS
jgi:hypothetical protein